MRRLLLAIAIMAGLAAAAPAAAQDRTLALIPQRTLASATTYTGEVIHLPQGIKTLAVLSKFVRAAGGTTTDVFVQTSLDGGVTWIDIMNHAYATTTASKVSVVKTDIAVSAGATPGDAALTDNTILDGLLGDRIRVKYVVVGDYTGASSITVSAVVN